MTTDLDQPWVPHDDADAGYALFAKDRRVVVDDGTTIAYTVLGADGPEPPILLASGWSCSDSYWVDLVPRFLDRGHPVVLPDTRGHGMSGLPRHPGRGARNLRDEDVAIPRLAADLLAVLDDAGLDRVVLVGHSMGVQTSLEAYRQHRDRFRGPRADRRHLREPAPHAVRHEPRRPRLRPRQRRDALDARDREPGVGHDRQQEGRPHGRPAGPGGRTEGDPRRDASLPAAPAHAGAAGDAEGGRGHARQLGGRPAPDHRGADAGDRRRQGRRSRPCAARWRCTGPSPTAS